MKKVLIVLLVLPVLGCTKFTNTLGAVQEAVIQARMTFQPVVDSICADLAKECTGEKTVEMNQDACEAYQVCYEVRDHIITTFEYINMLIADANMSAQIGDSDGAEESLAKALELVEQIRDQLRMLGYLQ